MVKVPVQRVPQTSLARPEPAYARPGQALDISPITNEIKSFAAEIEDERKKASIFALNKKLIDETVDLQTDFEARKTAAPLGANEFTTKLETDYETRHAAILDKYWKEGYDEKDLEDFDVRLTSLREKMSQRALQFQADSFAELGNKSFDEMVTKISQYAGETPDGYSSSKNELTTNAELVPGWTAAHREQKLQAALAVLRQGAGRGLVVKNPRYVIQMLDPRGYTAAPGGGISVTSQGITTSPEALLKEAEGFRTDAYWDVNHYRVGFGSDTATLSDGTIIKVTKDTVVTEEDAFRDLNRRIDLIENKASAEGGEGWNKLSSGAQAAVISVTYNYGEASKRLIPLWNAVKEGDGGKVAEIIESFSSDNEGVNAKRREKEAALARSSVPTTTTISAFDARPEPDIGSDSVDEAFQQGPNIVLNASTGNALLDDMTGFERWQLLAQAREQENKVSGTAKAAMDLEIGNAVSEFMATGTGRVLTKEQVLGAYGATPEGELKWRQYERASMSGPTVQAIKTLPPDRMAAEIEKLRPVVGSPTYELDLKFYEAAQQAQASVMKQRADDPAKSIFATFPEIPEKLSNAKTAEERRGVFLEMKRRYEQLGIPERERTYATDEMVASMKGQYAVAAPAMKLGILEQYMNELPDPEAAGPALKAFGGDKIVQDIALYATLRRLPGYQNTFMRVMAGKQLIDVDPVRKPNPSAINKAFAGQLGETLNVLSGEVSVMYNEAAAALYVEAGGRTDGGDILDEDLYTKSLNEAMGTEGIVDLNGGKVKELTILPRGVTQTDFENWKDNIHPNSFLGISVSRGQPSDKSNRPLTAEDIASEGVFVMRSPGVYGIKMMSDGAWVGNGQGRPYTVRLDAGTIKRRSTGQGVYVGTAQ